MIFGNTEIMLEIFKTTYLSFYLDFNIKINCTETIRFLQNVPDILESLENTKISNIVKIIYISIHI